MADFILCGGKSEAPARAECPPSGGHGAAGADFHKALSVTRHEQITDSNDVCSCWTYLTCGIDSLDLGLAVEWVKDWPTLFSDLERGKTAAIGSEGIPWRRIDENLLLIMPSAKPPNYRFRVQCA